MPEPPKLKILRIGVIQGGKIIEEKLVRKRATVTVGTSTRNTIVLPAANAPKSFSLFEIRGNEYYLAFTEDMTGRVSVADQATDLQSLKAQNLVRKSGNTYSLKLAESSRGRVAVGECIILFQFVAPPPEPVRTQLPVVVRGYWTHNIDWAYSSTFGTTMVCMLALVIWAHNVPLPKQMSIEDIPDRFAKMIMPDKVEEDKSKKEEEDGAGKTEEPPKPQKKETQKKEEQPLQDGEGDSEEAKAVKAVIHRAEVEKKVSGRGLLKLLGAKGPGGLAAGSAVADVFAEGTIEGSGDGVFDGIGGVDVATAAGQTGQRGVDGAGSAAGIEDLGTRGVVGGAGSGTKKKAEAQVVAKVTAAALSELDSDSRNQKDIIDVLRRRMGGIKVCYEKRLKRNPELKGKVVVRFVIHAGGSVTEAEVVENTTGDDELSGCIATWVKVIRFPAAEGGETTVTYPIILVPGSS